MRSLQSAIILGSRINALVWRQALDLLARWAVQRQSRHVCISNVHMVVTAREDRELAEAMRQADMVTPDGAPIAWMLRRLGFPDQTRISGTELMRAYLAEAAGRGEGIFLLGSTDKTLVRLKERLLADFPGLRIAGAISPPFRPLSEDEDAAIVTQINASGAGTVWVSLGCPKQEKWMLAHRGRVNAVMLGVGAAFDFIAGTKPRAPAWMQSAGLEWFHRVFSEPGRLWKRYLITNLLFVIGATGQLLRGRES
jgi:N-acetylglucosaminyldiphosphoundecaprenol N-acetyl-beta-D-mannosaminyltransferase